MVTLEQVEKLREKTNVSYNEAKAALEEAGGDILDAIIILEKQNRIEPPSGGGFYSTRDNPHSKGTGNREQDHERQSSKNSCSTFGELAGRFFRWCCKIIGIGNINSLEVRKDGNKVMSVPVTILALLLISMFWFVIPIMIVGLFLGYSYAFSGPDLGTENINRAMGSVTQAAESLKNEVKGERANGENTDH